MRNISTLSFRTLPRLQQVALLSGLVFLITSLVPIWGVAYPPLQDLPNHLVKVKIMLEHANPENGFADTYVLNQTIVPNFTFYGLVYVLAPLLGYMLAAKAVLTATLVALPVIGALWLRLVNRDWYFAAFGLLILQYNWFFNKGFINFSLSLAIYLLGLLLWETAYKRNSFGIPYQAVMCAIVLAMYFTHGYAVLVWGISLAIFAAYGAHGSWKKWLRQTGSLILAVVLCGMSFIRGSTSGQIDYEIKFPIAQLPWMFLQGSVESFAPQLERWIAAGLLLLILFGGARALKIACAPWRGSQNGGNQVPEQRLLTLLVVLSSLYLVLPITVRPYEYTKLRMVPFIVFLLLALSHIPKHPKLQHVVLAFLVASTLAVQMHTYGVYEWGSAQIQKAIAGIDVFPRGATLLPVIPGRTNRVGHTRPLLHVWGYYHLEKGGTGPYLHTIGNIHPVHYRKKLPAPREGADLDPEKAMEFLPFYDTALLVNADSVSKNLVRRWFDLIFVNETTELYRRRIVN
jgi:hypothetical protein